MYSLHTTALFLLSLVATALTQPLEERQAFPVNGECNTFDLPADRAFESFVHALYVEKNVTNAFSTYVYRNVRQHDPTISGGGVVEPGAFAGQWRAAEISLLHHGMLPDNTSMVHYIYAGAGLAPVNAVSQIASRVCVSVLTESRSTCTVSVAPV